MRIKLIAAGAAIALAATVGSASAADQFSTLEGIAAEAMTTQEMGVVIGTAVGDITLALPAGADPGGNAGGVAGGATRSTGAVGQTGNTRGIVSFE